MNIATALKIKVALRAEMCPRVLTIQSVDCVQITTPDGVIEAHQLAGADAQGTIYTVNLNQVTARQLITLTGSAETDDWTGQRVLVGTTVKGDKTYFAFAAAPAATVTAPARLPATGKNLPAPLSTEPDAGPTEGWHTHKHNGAGK
jgi:hypothetical protein